MCADCDKDTFKFAGHCHRCPGQFVGGWAWIAYLVAPAVTLFYFFPTIKHLVGGGIAPSLFVSIMFAQLCGVIGTIPLAWPEDVHSTLTAMNYLNFNIKFLLTDCSVPPPSR